MPQRCIYKIHYTCSLLVRYTMSETVETWKGYIYAILMFLTAIVNSLLIQSMFKLSFDIGGRTKASIISMVYKKVSMMEMLSIVCWQCYRYSTDI